MKKRLVVGLVSILSVTQVFASTARLTALGGSKVADRYFYDYRKVFYNPAAINESTDMAVFEWGKANAGSTTTYEPRPNGGVFLSNGSFAYGLYFGNVDNDALRISAAGTGTSETGTPSFLYQDNTFEFIIGADAGIQWGASVRYGNNKNEQAITGVAENLTPKRAQQSLDVNLGVMAGAIEAYVNLGLFDKSKNDETANSKAEFKANLAFDFGLVYNWDDFVAYGEYSKSGYEFSRASDGKKDREKDLSSWTLGFGKISRVDNNSKMFYDARLTSSNNKFTYGIATNTQNNTLENNTFSLPVTIGYETQVKDWLALRGSVQSNLYSQNKAGSGKKNKTVANSLDINAGATITLGKVHFDGLIGTSGWDGASNTEKNAKRGILSTKNLLTNVSMIYDF